MIQQANDTIIAANETMKTIYDRRAVRKYKKTPVPRSIVEHVLEAGMMAPSAMNRQPWKFYVVMDPDTIHAFSREIAKVAFNDVVHTGIREMVRTAAGLLHFSHSLNLHALKDPVFYEAPVVIFVTGPNDNEWAPLDIGMCCENMMLAARSLGLDSCPVGFAKYVERTAVYSRLQVPYSESVHLAVILGYGDECPSDRERRTDNILFID